MPAIQLYVGGNKLAEIDGSNYDILVDKINEIRYGSISSKDAQNQDLFNSNSRLGNFAAPINNVDLP